MMLRLYRVFNGAQANFKVTCHKQADLNIRNGDYSKAMESLLRASSKVNLSAVENTIKESLPPRSYNE